MTNHLGNPRRRILEQHLAKLYQDLEVIYGQMGHVLDDSDRLRLKRKVEVIEQEIEDADGKLSELERESPVSYRPFLDWEAQFSDLDFRMAWGIFQEVWQQLNAGGAALFLTQNCSVMGGEWFVARMHEAMHRTSDFRHVEIELGAEVQLSPIEFLNRLGQFYGFEPYSAGGAFRNYARNLLDRVCASLQSGSVVFLELRLWDTIGLSDQFLPWMMQDFWDPLVDRLPVIAEQHPLVKFVLAVLVNAPFSVDSIPSVFICQSREFDGQKVVELPLEFWTAEDIKSWLFRYAGLTSSAIGLSPAQVAHLADSIYLSGGNGQPTLVHHALMKALRNYYPRQKGVEHAGSLIHV